MRTAIEVRERPILFSGEMVRAILEWRKTQTRRVLKIDPQGTDQYWHRVTTEVTAPDEHGRWGLWSSSSREIGTDSVAAMRCPYGRPGDRLWVREAHRAVRINGVAGGYAEFPDVQYREGFGVLGFSPRGTDLRARQEALAASVARWEPSETGNLWGPWRPSIHMPRWASRIMLELTDVRVERVQEISDSDCETEGLEPTPGHLQFAHRHAFMTLWDRINGPRGYGWDANPWVWVLAFRRVEGDR